jgi:hypothetical protein
MAMNTKTRMVVVGTVLTATALSAGTASAVVAGFNGGAQTQRLVRTESDATTAAGTTFTNIPNAAVAVRVPSRQTRLITGRFTAESQCTGSSFGWCSVRLIARNSSTGTVVVLHPRSDLDFAFDSVSNDDLWESHSVARTIRLGAGSWRVIAQRATTSDSVTARHDDWTLEVDVNR